MRKQLVTYLYISVDDAMREVCRRHGELREFVTEALEDLLTRKRVSERQFTNAQRSLSGPRRKFSVNLDERLIKKVKEYSRKHRYPILDVVNAAIVARLRKRGIKINTEA